MSDRSSLLAVELAEQRALGIELPDVPPPHKPAAQLPPPAELHDDDIYRPGRAYRLSILFAYLFSFVMGFGYGVCLPSMERFVTGPRIPPAGTPAGLAGSESWYSAAIAAYSIGEVFGSLLFGWMASRISTKRVILLSSPLGVAGNLLYAMASRAWMLALGRLLLGLLTGAMNTVLRSYLVRATLPQQRTTASAIWAMCAAVSMGFGPLFTSLVLTRTTFESKFFAFDIYRSPGWVMALLCAAMALLTAVAFFEIAYPVGQRIPRDPITGQLQLKRGEVVVEKRIWAPGRAPSLIVVSVISIFGVVTIGFSMIEAVFPVLFTDQWGISVERSSYIYIGVAAAILVTGLLVPLLKRVANERTLVLVSLIAGVVGLLVGTDFQAMGPRDPCNRWSCHNRSCSLDSGNLTAALAAGCNRMHRAHDCVWNQHGPFGLCSDCSPLCHSPARTLNLYQFCVCAVLLAFSFACGRAACSSLYSFIIKSKNQGTMTSFLMIGGSLARIAVPFFSGTLYYAFHRHTYGLSLALGSIYFVHAVFMAAFWRRLDPDRYDAVGDAGTFADRLMSVQK